MAYSGERQVCLTVKRILCHIIHTLISCFLFFKQIFRFLIFFSKINFIQKLVSFLLIISIQGMDHLFGHKFITRIRCTQFTDHEPTFKLKYWENLSSESSLAPNPGHLVFSTTKKKEKQRINQTREKTSIKLSPVIMIILQIVVLVCFYNINRSILWQEPTWKSRQ